MTTLYLMRHGDASSVGGEIHEDSQRPLSVQGQEQTRRVAEGFHQQEKELASVISSPLIRAQETARIMADVIGVKSVKVSPVLAPNAFPAGLPKFIASLIDMESVLLVGHHPDVTLWIAFLTGLDPSVCPLFGTASIASLKILGSGKKADFLWFKTSDQLAHV